MASGRRPSTSEAPHDRKAIRVDERLFIKRVFYISWRIDYWHRPAGMLMNSCGVAERYTGSRLVFIAGVRLGAICRAALFCSGAELDADGITTSIRRADMPRARPHRMTRHTADDREYYKLDWRRSRGAVQAVDGGAATPGLSGVD